MATNLINLNIKNENHMCTVQVPRDTTIAKLKQQIIRCFPNIHNIELLFEGKILYTIRTNIK